MGVAVHRFDVRRARRHARLGDDVEPSRTSSRAAAVWTGSRASTSCRLAGGRAPATVRRTTGYGKVES
jgi:hypothetical protein